MSKTPYEIRLEVLRLAQDHITAKFWNDWEREKLIIERENKGLGVPVPAEVPSPVFPTTEDILAEAVKFKKFVDQE